MRPSSLLLRIKTKQEIWDGWGEPILILWVKFCFIWRGIWRIWRLNLKCQHVLKGSKPISDMENKKKKERKKKGFLSMRYKWPLRKCSLLLYSDMTRQKKNPQCSCDTDDDDGWRSGCAGESGGERTNTKRDECWGIASTYFAVGALINDCHQCVSQWTPPNTFCHQFHHLSDEKLLLPV